MYQPRLALITGASSGLGLAFAKALAARNTELILVARRQTALESARDAIHAQTPTARITLVATDVSERQQLASLMEESQKHGDLDLLINSAGILRVDTFENMTASDFREQIEINLMGTVNMVGICLPQLKRTRGRIVNISSLAGTTGVFGGSAYCASKYAINGFSESLRYELKQHGVAVHLVCPGEFSSPMLDALQGTRLPENAAHAGSIPRITTEDVVRDTLKGINQEKFFIVPGRLARIAAAGIRHFPTMNRYAGDWRIAGVHKKHRGA